MLFSHLSLAIGAFASMGSAHPLPPPDHSGGHVGLETRNVTIPGIPGTVFMPQRRPSWLKQMFDYMYHHPTHQPAPKEYPSYIYYKRSNEKQNITSSPSPKGPPADSDDKTYIAPLNNDSGGLTFDKRKNPLPSPTQPLPDETIFVPSPGYDKGEFTIEKRNVSALPSPIMPPPEKPTVEPPYFVQGQFKREKRDTTDGQVTENPIKDWWDHKFHGDPNAPKTNPYPEDARSIEKRDTTATQVNENPIRDWWDHKFHGDPNAPKPKPYSKDGHSIERRNVSTSNTIMAPQVDKNWFKDLWGKASSWMTGKSSPSEPSGGLGNPGSSPGNPSLPVATRPPRYEDSEYYHAHSSNSFKDGPPPPSKGGWLDIIAEKVFRADTYEGYIDHDSPQAKFREEEYKKHPETKEILDRFLSKGDKMKVEKQLAAGKVQMDPKEHELLNKDLAAENKWLATTVAQWKKDAAKDGISIGDDKSKGSPTDNPADDSKKPAQKGA